MKRKKTFSQEKWENVRFNGTPQTNAGTDGAGQQSVVSASSSSGAGFNNHAYDADETREHIEEVVRRIELKAVDIAPDYKDWVCLGFAIASEFPNDYGKGLFIRISQYYHDYNQSKTVKQWNKCLNSKGGGVSIATFFNMAKKAGVDISKPRRDAVIIPEPKPIPTPKTNGSMVLWSLQDKQPQHLLEYKSDIPANIKTADSQDQKTKRPKDQSVDSGGSGGSKWICDEEDLPHFPLWVYDTLSPFLHEAIGLCTESENCDMVLMGLITCLSATLHNVSGIYDRNRLYPMLYYFVMAEAGMGKGALMYCRQIVSPINREIREISERQIRDYKEELALARKEGKTLAGPEPKRKSLFIPTNSSAASFIEQLDNNEGIGLLFDTECDTLSSVLKSDFGDYSSYLRKGYHHEPIEMSRRKDNEFRVIEKPMLAVCLSGTPEQLHTLTPDAENGLFSRILTYHIPFKAEFRDTLVSDIGGGDYNVSVSDQFYQLGERYKLRREAFFRGGEYTITIPAHLCGIFNEHFRKLNYEVVDDISNAMQGIVRRIAVAVYRIMMVLTAVRFMDEHPNPSAGRRGEDIIRVECSEDDFRIAMAIGDTLIYHSAYCYTHLPKTITKIGMNGRILSKADKMNMLYDALADTFDKQQYREACEQLRFSPHTAYKWINDYIIQGRLVRDSKDHYHKVK